MDDYNIFSYEDYKNSSLELKLKKIKLLNEYYKFKKLSKIRVYIDFDGVILDTMSIANELLIENHGINIINNDYISDDEEKEIANFFINLNWKKLLNEADEINKSKSFIKLIKESNIYEPIIYSAVNSENEKNEKSTFLDRKLKNVEYKFIAVRNPKICDDRNSIIVDDSDFNLINWYGYPIHFDSKINSIFPTIDDLGEIYYLFYENKYKEGLYDDFIREEDVKTKKVTWKKKI